MATTRAVSVRWRLPSPAVVLAALGGILLLLDAVRLSLLLGTYDELSSPAHVVLPIVLLLAGLAALCAARILPGAPRSGALLCLLAIATVSGVHLLPFIQLVVDTYQNRHRFMPQEASLGELISPLLAWLVIVAPLLCSSVLAWRQAPPNQRQTPKGSLASGGERGL